MVFYGIIISQNIRKRGLMRTMFRYVIMGVCLGMAISLAYGAEVDEVQETDIPPELITTELEEAIELKEEDEFKIIPLIDITALGTYSTMAGGNDIGGADVKGSIAPVLRLDSKNYIIPLYYGAYNRQRQVVIEEEGGRVYNEIMDHNATLEYKHAVNEKTSVKLDGLARFHYVKEKGDDWSDGLYDYEDLGVGASVEHFIIKTPARKHSVALGGEIYRREYPNYKSLISLASTTTPETDEKDYMGYRGILRYNYLTNKFRCAFLYSPIFKDFEDKKTIGSLGFLQDGEREDWFHYANLNLSYLPEDSPIAIGVALTGIMVKSGQNYYDSRDTARLDDDVYTDNYYDFMSLNTNPYITYIHKLKDKKLPATFTVGYAYLVRDYEDRKKQEADGTYTDDTQLDEAHTVNFQVVYPINDHISALALGRWTKGLSNMKYETYYQYRYETTFLGGGLRIKY